MEKDLITQLEDVVAEMRVDADKFYIKGNSAAGTRVRTGAMVAKGLLQEIRVDVQATKNNK